MAVVVIVFGGIVLSIAIPQLVMTRSRTFDAAAQAELASVGMAEEVYRVEHGSYSLYLEDLAFDDDPAVTTTVLWADDSDYEICSTHPESRSSWRRRGTVGNVERLWGPC